MKENINLQLAENVVLVGKIHQRERLLPGGEKNRNSRGSVVVGGAGVSVW